MSTKDPVCNMDVDEDSAVAGLEYEGEVYYFSSRECMEKFEANPAEYVKKPAAAE